MPINRGKQFERVFLLDWKKSFPGGTIDRIYDTVNGYKTISNVCDFIGYAYPSIMYLECKSHYGATWSFNYFTQYDKLSTKIGKKGVIAGAVLWMIDYDKVVFLPVEEVKKMKADGLKSFNIKMLDQKDENGNLLYNIAIIPSVKKQVFMESDYSVLLKEENNDR